MPVATPRPPLRRLLALSAVFFALGAASVVAQPFSAVLAGGNEVPPVETDASGAVLATLDGTDLTLTGSFAGLTGDYAASHIHVAPAGANGPVVVGLNPAVGGDSRSGTFDETVTLSAADVEALENGELYVNVHSAAFGSGEIRGQLLGAVQINELRTDQPGSDDDEYAELTGPPGTALDGYTYLVIGDSGAGGSGVIEFVLDLAGQTIPDDGLFLLAEDDDTFGAEADLITALNFENGESVTHVLVQGFSGSDGQDLDTDDDGGLEDSPWTTAVDAVGFVDDVDDFAYGAQLGFEDLGPVGAFPPAHAYRDGETGDWIIGEFDPAESADTPGAPNPALGEVPVVFFTEEFGAVIEGESAEFFVEIDYPGAPDGVPVTVAVAFAPDESTADASDFTYAPESVTFSGDTDNEQVAVTLMAVPDEAVEGEETANFILSVIEGAATVAPPGAIGITIQDATEGGTARLQVIHNAPDPAAQVVDVYVDGVLLLDDLAFRTGTAFLDVPAGVPLEVAVAPGDSGDAGDAVFTETYTLDADAAVQLVAVGVLDPSGFEPNPAGIDIGFTLLVAPDAREEGSPGLVDVRGVHGTPDAPVIDLYAPDFDAVLLDDVAYQDVSPYVQVLPLSATIQVTPADDNTTALATFELDLAPFAGQAVVALASGFFTPENEDDTAGTPPSFGLLIVLADGTETLIEPASTDADEGAALPEAFVLGGAYPNPFATATTLAFSLPADAEVRVAVFDVLGREVLTVAPQPVTAGADRTLRLDGAGLAAGTYVVRLTAKAAGETLVGTGRLTVVR